MQDFVGAGIVGQHWLAFLDAADDARSSTLRLTNKYSGPPFAYVINDAQQRARFRAAGVSMMTDCIPRDLSCHEDILDPIVRHHKS